MTQNAIATERNVIDDLNNKYFSAEREKVNIMADLGSCIQRLITVFVVEDLMKIASTGYEPEHEDKETFTNDDGRKFEQITVRHIDKYNFATLRNIHESLMDALVLSLRNLFYCKKDSNAAGAFVKEISKLPNLSELNKAHLSHTNVMCYLSEVKFATNEDVRAGIITLGDNQVSLDGLTLDESFILANQDKGYAVVYDLDSQKAYDLAKEFCRKHYICKKDTNLPEIKSYEQFHFHKDRWPDNKRYEITTTTRIIYGLKTNCHHYHDVCEVDFSEIIASLEEMSEIMNLYYRSCVSGYMNYSMNIWCNVYCSLDRMVADIIHLFNIDVSTDFRQKVIDNIEKRIPKSISVMLLR